MIGIIIVNFNSWRDTVECLESLLRLNAENYKIVIVDNDSTDESVKNIIDWACGAIAADLQHDIWKKLKPERSVEPKLKFIDKNYEVKEDDSNIILLSSSINGGFAHGNNIGIKYSLEVLNCDGVWLINADTVADENALSEIMNLSHSQSDLGIIGSTLIYYYNSEFIQGTGVKFNVFTTIASQINNNKRLDDVNLNFFPENSISYVIGASMFISKRYIENVGFLCEDYFLYFEEFDLFSRGKSSYNQSIAMKSLVYHKEGGAIGSSTTKRPSNLSIFYMTRGIIIFYKKYYKFLIPVALLRIAFNYIRFKFYGDSDGCRSIRAALISLWLNKDSGFQPPHIGVSHLFFDKRNL